MGIFSWIFLGLIAAAIAKFVMPGKDPGGIIVTILIGIAGAIVGGFLGSFVGLGKVESFDLGGIFIATVGAIILLIIDRLLKKKIVATIDDLHFHGCALAWRTHQVDRFVKYFGISNFTYQGRDGFVFAGRVDTGSSDKILAILHAKFQKLKAPFCPLVNCRGIQRQMGFGITAFKWFPDPIDFSVKYPKVVLPT